MRLLAWFALIPAFAVAAPPYKIAGTWEAKLPKVKITMVFAPNGQYNSVNVRGGSTTSFGGKYELQGRVLRLHVTSTTAWQNGRPRTTHLDRQGDAQITWKDENHILLGAGSGPTTAFVRTGRH